MSRTQSELGTRKRSAGVSVSARSLHVKGSKERADMSRQNDDSDVFILDSTSSTVIVDPPFNLKSLHIVHEKSNILRQCIQAYITNITANGWRVIPYDSEAKPDPVETKTLKSFIDSANTEQSLQSLEREMVQYYEKYGFTFIELIRDKAGSPSMLRSACPASIRATTRSGDEITVTIRIDRGGRRRRVVERKRFRKYIQQIGATTTYFKEFGDPRRMHYLTGEYETKEKPVADEDLATELIHHKQPSEDLYGVPRWISMLPAILGSREAEEVNLRYFEDNTVPPMILTVAGGRLTAQSYKDLKDILNASGVGKKRQNQIMLLEAVPEVADIDGKGTVQLKVDKLASERPSDGLFSEYDEANMAKVRSAFRLPPVFLGMSQDMTFATANVSAYIAEVQVFSPERAVHDEMFNKKFVNHPQGLNLKTVKLESRGPTITSPDQVVKTLTALNVMGGVTPRNAIDVVNEVMQLSIPQYPEKGTEGWMEWMDSPMPLTQATAKSQQTGEGSTTHAGQRSKDAGIKQTEQDGDVNMRQPEHGQE